MIEAFLVIYGIGAIVCLFCSFLMLTNDNMESALTYFIIAPFWPIFWLKVAVMTLVGR